ncbi:inactive lysozyme 1A-like [Condylostylus longicornis]|uniref:inactive lysozyme 1A-like n=1 Tax=Condylostylus longicornis TaxID=2530218 RepID=UPI00244DD939|nr:inactive lysozyme 1A-like [Condylostylus longicornis]
MNFKFLLISFGLLLVLQITYGKKFDECSLAKELYRLGVPKSQLSDWICLAKYESQFETSTVGKKNSNGTRDWGIFQINDRWWCKNSNGDRSYNQCKLSCDELLTDDITKAVKCAKLIKKQQGFKAWVAWNRRCQGSKPNISKCF